jgi:hypothetical protein
MLADRVKFNIAVTELYGQRDEDFVDSCGLCVWGNCPADICAL